ncbi:MAG: tetratricopeptide repeat-containing sulfotransferase family protein [Fimbriimonadaceae bacterium]
MQSKGFVPSRVFQAGQVAEAGGRVGEAERHYLSVASSDACYVLAQLRLGVIAGRTNRTNLARQYFDTVLELDPRCVEALNWLAGFARTDGRPSEAIDLCRRALAIEPNSPQLWFGLAQSYLDEWFNVEAIDALEHVTRLDPRAVAAWDRLGTALLREDRFEEAIAAYRQAISLAPTMPTSYVGLAHLLFHEGQPEEATAVQRQGRDVASGSAQALVAYANACLEVGDDLESEWGARRAAELAPDAEYPQALLAYVLQRQGKFDDARVVLLNALNQIPHSARIGFDLAYCGRFTEADRPSITNLEVSAGLPNRTSEDLDRLHYALGKAYDDVGDYVAALAHFVKANELAKRRLSAVADKRVHLTAMIDRMIELFTPEAIAELRALGSASEQPIFILGMLRSGTTLTEQIVSSHRDVVAGGELSYLSDHAQEVISASRLNPKKLAGVANGYLRRLRAVGGAATRVTDKMPSNIFVAGLVHAMFPNGRIIFCRRNVLDNCLSLYVTPYDAPQDFLHSAESIAFFYEEHVRMMAHWARVIPSNRLLTVDYEMLVGSREPTVRQVVEFLGLPWDNACLDHPSNPRSVDTPSRWQVRQPLFDRSVGRWRHYLPWIEELRALDHSWGQATSSSDTTSLR